MYGGVTAFAASISFPFRVDMINDRHYLEQDKQYPWKQFLRMRIFSIIIHLTCTLYMEIHSNIGHDIMRGLYISVLLR